MYKVTFYDNINTFKSGNKKSYTGVFRSLRTFSRFIYYYENLGGFCRFNYDLWGEVESTNGLPVIPCSSTGFNLVYSALYPDLS